MLSELTIILAIISLVSSVCFGFINMRRGHKTDDSSSGREMGALLSDIAYVKVSVDGLSREIKTYDDRFTSIRERLSAVEVSAEKAHRRVDTIMGKIVGEAEI